MTPIALEPTLPQQLVLALRQTLSHQPSQVGMRLQSEEKLASELKIGRRQIRDAINKLVDDGVLVRQRGSGTFVRQLPKPPADIPQAPNLLKAQVLFASDGHRNINASRERHNSAIANKQVLHIGLWGDMHCSTETNLVGIQGILEATQQAGHRLSLHSMIQSANVGFSPRELADEMQRHPCDAYLITGLWGELFEEAAAVAQIPDSRPRVYVGARSLDESLEPMVSPDLIQTTYRAMSIFYKQGLRRLTTLIHDNIAAHVVREIQAVVKNFQDEHSDCTCDLVSETPSFAGGMKAVRALYEDKEDSQMPEGLFVFDSRMIEGVAETLHLLNMKPGRETGLILLANRGVKVIDLYDWSKLEMDIIQVGRLAVQCLLQQLSEHDQQPCSLLMRPRWVPGKTHTCTRTQTEIDDDHQDR